MHCCSSLVWGGWFTSGWGLSWWNFLADPFWTHWWSWLCLVTRNSATRLSYLCLQIATLVLVSTERISLVKFLVPNEYKNRQIWHPHPCSPRSPVSPCAGVSSGLSWRTACLSWGTNNSGMLILGIYATYHLIQVTLVHSISSVIYLIHTLVYDLYKIYHQITWSERCRELPVSVQSLAYIIQVILITYEGWERFVKWS